MSYYFSEEHNLFREGLKQFLNKEVRPYIEQWEEDERIPKELWKKFGDMGYLGLNYPEAYGGMDADFFYSVVFIEEISKCHSGGFAITPCVQQYMSSPYIYKYGSEFLKKKYLSKAISGEWICAIGITEPGAGSDVANIQTKATRQGEHYIVNGAKTFITNAYYGDFVIAVVKTDPDAGINGVSLLIIDLQSEGVSKRKLKKLGWHASDTAELNFDDVRVPVENLIGEEGQGFFYLMGGLQTERLTGAVMAIGACENALEYTMQYMTERNAFGRPISKFQVLRHRIAQLATEIEAGKALTYHACRMHNDGHYAVKECSMAKLLLTELSDKVAYQCLQMFGGYGYMEEYKMARMFRDSRIGTIGGGTSEIMREIIAKMVIDDKTYQSATTNPTKTHNSPKQPKEQPTTNPPTDLHTLTAKIAHNALKAKPLGSTLKFQFDTDNSIHLDGTGPQNQVTNNHNAPAQCTVKVKITDFEALIAGKLDPMSAFMSGKLQVEGDMGVAMKLQSIFKS